MGSKDAKHFSDALEWIEHNVPDGIRIVALALSETYDAAPPSSQEAPAAPRETRCQVHQYGLDGKKWRCGSRLPCPYHPGFTEPAPAAEPGPITGEDSARLLAGLPAAEPGEREAPLGKCEDCGAAVPDTQIWCWPCYHLIQDAHNSPCTAPECPEHGDLRPPAAPRGLDDAGRGT